MPVDQHKNLAYSTIVTPPSPADSGTTLLLVTGQSARFPTVPFNATIWPIAQIPTPSNAEIVRVTGVSVDTITITRAQEGTGARTILAGDQIVAGITAKTITDIESLSAGAILANVAYTGKLIAGDAVSVFVPGATSLSFRNHADSADNLIITDAGNATLRGSMTFSATTLPHIVSQVATTLPDTTAVVSQWYSGSTVTSGSPTGQPQYKDIVSQSNFVGANPINEFAGLYGLNAFQGSGGTTTFLISVHGRAIYQGTGASIVSNLVGTYSRIHAKVEGVGAVTNSYGFWAPSPIYDGAATITNSYNLSLEANSNQLATITNYYGAVIGMPTGGVSSNIGVLIGAVATGFTSHLAVRGTLTDPVTASKNPIQFVMSEALTGNTAAVISNVLSQYNVASTAFNHTGNVTAVEAQVSTAGSGTFSVIAGMSAKVQHIGTGAATSVYGLDAGVLLRANATGTGTPDGNITTAAAIHAQLQNLGTSVTPGVITSGRTILINSPAFSTTGIINTQYGLYVVNQGNAKVANAGNGTSYGIYVAAQSGSEGNSYALETAGGGLRFTPSMTKVRASNSIWNGISVLASTLTLTTMGSITTTTGVNLINVAIPNIATDAAGAITASATLAILGAPTISGGGTITSPYAIWSQGGANRFDGDVILTGTGTTMIVGFNYMPGGAGAPTGVPTNASATRIPFYYDVTNNFLYVYNGGWKKSTVYA